MMNKRYIENRSYISSRTVQILLSGFVSKTGIRPQVVLDTPTNISRVIVYFKGYTFALIPVVEQYRVHSQKGSIARPLLGSPS